MIKNYKNLIFKKCSLKQIKQHLTHLHLYLYINKKYDQSKLCE